jgi:hypothetical protein
MEIFWCALRIFFKEIPEAKLNVFLEGFRFPGMR